MDGSNIYLDSLFEALEIIAEGNYVYLCDMKRDYSRWSQNAVDYFGLPDIYMTGAGKIWEQHIHPDDREHYRTNIADIFNGVDRGHDMQYRALSADGSYVVCTCKGVVMNGPDGKPAYFAGSIKNHGSMSYIDNITGLRSLYGFFDDLKSLYFKKTECTAMVVGISGFSVLNDIYGYSFGNMILQKFANLIHGTFSEFGWVYRMDGTKFAVLSRSLTADDFVTMYNNIRERVSHGFFVDDERMSLSLNAGVAVVDDFEINSETIYSCLKNAYYESRNRRLGEAVVFENTISGDNKKLIEKINKIRNCIFEDCRGFYLCYQPIVDSRTEELRGVEALLRWKDNEYGTVPPIQYVPVLEQDAIFPELGRWILRRAMEDGKLFVAKNPGFLMHVNVSYAQLKRSDFVADVFRILAETGYRAENLCIEITERCRLLNMDMLKNMFCVLQAAGVKIALDDFGTGFASIGVLRELPIDIVKIDREFVKNIETSLPDQHTVRFISSLAADFSAEVCVEGVETIGMCDCLRKFSVSAFQGYYYSMPVTLEELMKKDL
ncbi:MAG: EAL domain-containing protein [Ruminococcus sp.]|nr:EAL domain-containing protein [Ruminococcus sp.]